MQVYDIGIIGAGPAGIMSAIHASSFRKNVILFERNNRIGRKILLSGKGRCNITNVSSIDDFISKFGEEGKFLRPAFLKFFNEDLIDFFKTNGLDLKIERQGRAFPITDKAISIIEVLEGRLLKEKVKVEYNKRVVNIKKDDSFRLFLEDGSEFRARKVILATGGLSFKATGSTGDGFSIAGKLGHTVVPLRPALVPLKTKEPWVKVLKGLTLKNIRLTFTSRTKKIISPVGQLQFTHFGVSGPLVLDLSSEVVKLLEDDKDVCLYIDLKPGLTYEQLENRLLNDFKLYGNKGIRGFLKNLLPFNFISVFLNLLKFDYNKKVNQINKVERQAIVNLLKNFKLHIAGPLPIEEAMVTSGGVSTKEINPKTMESRIVSGLYFAGEIIDVAASSGGYNLQAAFSTGYLAGEAATIAS